MEQNTIAIIWDFDKTLINGYMQQPLFKKYGIKDKDFWAEVGSLTKAYADKGVRVNVDTIYLNHILTCVNQGIMPGLNNNILFELGSELEFYAGIPKIFEALKDEVQKNPDYQKFSIHVEHYIISTGLAEMIKGSVISKYVDGIWGCEFIETPIRSNLDAKIYKKEQEEPGVLTQTGYIIDNTSKTRAIFEINKGSNKFDIDVNGRIDEKDRRVPFSNMIYIADGPSDVPVFSVLKHNGGRTFAIYPKGDIEGLKQVDSLIRDKRIDMYAEADYSEGTTAYLWLMEQTKEIAGAIYERFMRQIEASASKPPSHLT